MFSISWRPTPAKRDGQFHYMMQTLEHRWSTRCWCQRPQCFWICLDEYFCLFLHLNFRPDHSSHTQNSMFWTLFMSTVTVTYCGWGRDTDFPAGQAAHSVSFKAVPVQMHHSHTHSHVYVRYSTTSTVHCPFFTLNFLITIRFDELSWWTHMCVFLCSFTVIIWQPTCTEESVQRFTCCIPDANTVRGYLQAQICKEYIKTNEKNTVFRRHGLSKKTSVSLSWGVL